MKHLVMIHGRSQQDKDAAELKKTWVAALSKGLEAANLSLVLDETKIHFPYYGDTLVGLMNDVPDPAPIVVKAASDSASREADFKMSLLKEMLRQNGVSDQDIKLELAHGDAAHLVQEKGPLNWPWILAGLRVLDRVKAGAWAVSTFTHDVWVYLDDQAIREKINTGVRAAYCGEPTVILSHSLGTIVAYAILKSDYAKDWKVPTLITLGSPLGIEAVWSRLRPVDPAACVGEWFNGRDPLDTVALYPLTPSPFENSVITSKNTIKNTSDNHHGIESYLADPDVARWIHDAIQ